MFHILFDSRGVELLQAAMDLDNSLDGETVLICDDYSVGPIQDLFSPSGRELRNTWLRETLDEKPTLTHTEGGDSDTDKLTSIVARMGEEEFDQIWIWLAPNARDISGYYWLISQLADFSGRIYVLSLNNLPFINEKGMVFYPSTLAEIPSREFVKARKLARPVSAAEFETDPDEWQRLASENKILRILEAGKKIVQKEETQFDNSLLNLLQPTFQKITRTISLFLQKSPDKVNESFLNWRIRQLVQNGAAEKQGDSVKGLVKSAEEV